MREKATNHKPTRFNHYWVVLVVLVGGWVSGCGGGRGCSLMKRLTNHDLYSLKQRFAQLTTFKCHPTAKSAYQRQAMHRDEDVCGRIIFLPHRFHPSPKKSHQISLFCQIFWQGKKYKCQHILCGNPSVAN